MLDLAIRGTLLLVLAFVGAILLRRASAAARHLLWASALAGLLVLPAITRLGPAVSVTVPAGIVAPVAPHDDAPAALAPARVDDPAPAIAEPAITVVRTRTHDVHMRSRVRAHASVHVDALSAPEAAPEPEAAPDAP